MTDLKAKLVKLGSTHPDLRPHIKKILTAASFTTPADHMNRAMKDVAEHTFDMFERHVKDGTMSKMLNPRKFVYGWKFEHMGTGYEVAIQMRGDGHIQLLFQDNRRVLVSGGDHFEDFDNRTVMDFINDVSDEMGLQ